MHNEADGLILCKGQRQGEDALPSCLNLSLTQFDITLNLCGIFVCSYVNICFTTLAMVGAK